MVSLRNPQHQPMHPWALGKAPNLNFFPSCLSGSHAAVSNVMSCSVTTQEQPREPSLWWKHTTLSASFGGEGGIIEKNHGSAQLRRHLPMLLHCIYSLNSPGQAQLLKLAGVKPQLVCFPLLEQGGGFFLRSEVMDLVTHYLGHPALHAQGKLLFPSLCFQALLSLWPHSQFEKQYFIWW